MGGSWSWFEDETGAYQFGSSVNAKEEEKYLESKALTKRWWGFHSPNKGLRTGRTASGMVTRVALLNIVFHFFRSK